MHPLLFCVLLPFVGTALDSLATPKMAKASFLTNESGLGFFPSNLRKIALIPALSVVSSRSTCPRSLMMFGIIFIQPIAATNCPFCFGNIPTCTFGAASGAACPAEVVPRENAAIITGSATGSLKLAGCLAPRFLRMLTRSELSTVTTLANRPPPGTAVTFTKTTKLKDLMVYMKQGLISKEQIEVTFAEFIDAESNAEKKKELRENVKFLINAVDGAAGMDEDPGGLYTWLLGMVVSFVLTGTVVTTATLSSGSTTASTSTAKHKTKIPRPTSLINLLEILNLYVMFFVALGLGPTSVITSFIQCVVIDSIVVRKYEWYVAFELMIVLFRKIENSVGNKFNLGNVIDEVHLNSALEEASEAAKMFFRTRGGAPHVGDRESLLDTNKKPFNGKFNKDEKCRACAVFNSGGDHKPHMLTDDGTCRFGHKCDHWVSDQGPGGVCRNKAGKPGHNRRNCDNPNKCDSKLQ